QLFNSRSRGCCLFNCVDWHLFCRCCLCSLQSIVLQMKLEGLGYCICDGFHAVRTEACCTAAADAFQMFDQHLHLVAMIAVTKEQGAHATEGLGHRKHVRTCLAHVQEYFYWLTVVIIHRNIGHAERSVKLVCRSAKNLWPFQIISVPVAIAITIA